MTSSSQTINVEQGITPDLFAEDCSPRPAQENLNNGPTLLRGLITQDEIAVLEAIESVLAQAPLREVFTPSGLRMSVTMSNCGHVGWISDRHGYRYSAQDPATGNPWPQMPELFRQIAQMAAAQAGFPDFAPDACLINRYATGARMSPHQDKDELDLQAPIVSISLGLPALFLFGGLRRQDKMQKIPLEHGDIVVWGGPVRLAFHGIQTLAAGEHPLLGAQRLNLTFRKAR